MNQTTDDMGSVPNIFIIDIDIHNAEVESRLGTRQPAVNQQRLYSMCTSSNWSRRVRHTPIRVKLGSVEDKNVIYSKMTQRSEQ